MLKTRIIPCLDVADGRVVKGVNFVDLRDAGDPVEPCKQRGQHVDQQQHLQPCPHAGLRVLEGTAVVMRLEVSERRFDLHAQAVEPDQLACAVIAQFWCARQDPRFALTACHLVRFSTPSALAVTPAFLLPTFT